MTGARRRYRLYHCFESDFSTYYLQNESRHNILGFGIRRTVPIYVTVFGFRF
jgi:hypothetical protein